MDRNFTFLSSHLSSRNILLLICWFMAFLTAAETASAWFVVTRVSVGRFPLPPNVTKYQVISDATFDQSRYQRDATHGNSITVGSISNSPFAHTIRGKFTPGQVFTCGAFARDIFNPHPCAAESYAAKRPCTANVTLASTAEVLTTGFGGWRSESSWGGTNERADCIIIEPPRCEAAYYRTRYQHLDLDGRVSLMKPKVLPTRPLRLSEEIGGDHYYRNEWLVAERSSSTGDYEIIEATTAEFASEGLAVLADSSSRRAGPDTVLLIKHAEHQQSETSMLPPRASFDHEFATLPRQRGVRDLRDDPIRGPEWPERLEDEPDWRFLARFDVLETGDRTAEVLWSESEVPEEWLLRLRDELSLGFPIGERHRAVVYAVVHAGNSVRVGQRLVVLPMCCCNGRLCR